MNDPEASPTTPARIPRVTGIRVEYDDGSCDTVKPSQVNPIMLYGLARNRPDSVSKPAAYTAGAVAGLLFRTAVTGERTEKPFDDPRLIEVLSHWFEPPQSP